MNKRKTVVIFMVMLVLLLSGCGASTNMSAYEYAAEAPQSAALDASYDYAGSNGGYTDDLYKAESEAVYTEAEEAGTGGGQTKTPDQSRKLIKDVTIHAETEEFDQLLANVESRMEALGGYMEHFNMYNGSGYYGETNRNADLTIRIPAAQLSAFVAEVAQISNITSRSESVQDVTLQYVDLESHKKSLLVEQQRLLELLEQAETIEDIIALESRLSQVRYQLESMESQLRTYDNLVDYSTVYLYINEVKKLTPVEEQTTWQKISTGFMNNLESLGKGLVNFGIGFIVASPYLLFWAVIIAIIAFMVIKGLKKKNKKEKKKLPKHSESTEENNKPQEKKE